MPTLRRLRSAHALALAVALLATLLVTFTVPAEPAHAVRKLRAAAVTNGPFADPGFAKFRGRFFIYRTGDFGVKSSTRPTTGYGPVTQTVAGPPPWADINPRSGNYDMWSPDVFVVHGARRPFVMYFSAYDRRHRHCIGVATATAPEGPFVYKRKPLMCGNGDYEVIDGAHFTRHGKRFLIYKSAIDNDSGTSSIRAVQVDRRTATRRVRQAFTLIHKHKGKRYEAPSVVAHRGKLWLFVSTGYWASCEYSTQAYVARRLRPTAKQKQSFRRVRTLIKSHRSAEACGTGGAAVFRDGRVVRIAFHSFDNFKPDPGQKRRLWIGKVGWIGGKPYLR